MANYQKHTRTAVGHLTKHYERGKDERSEYIKFGNQDIDPERTPLNYNLAPEHDQVKFVRQRCSEVQCLNRKDVNVMCSWVVTVPKGLDKSEEQAFFKHTYDFLADRYGEKNVVSAYVHLDETTPHMHFAFVPVVIDKNKGIEKVSAKEKVTKTDLQSFHGDLEKYLEHYLEREVGILNESTKEGNKSITELKRGSAREELQNIKQTIKDLEEKINGLQQAREVYRGELKDLQEALKKAEGVQATHYEIDSIEGKTGAFSKDKVTIATKDFEKLKEVAKKGATLTYEVEGLQGEIKRVKNREDRMENLAHKLRQENTDLKGEVQKFKVAYKTLSDKHYIAKKLLAQHGVDEKKADYLINETHKQLQERQQAKEKVLKPKFRSMGMER